MSDNDIVLSEINDKYGLIETLLYVSVIIQHHQTSCVIICQALPPFIVLREAALNINRCHRHPNSDRKMVAALNWAENLADT